MQVRGPLDQRGDEVADPVGQPVGRDPVRVALARKHLDLEVEIPADQQNLALGGRHDVPEHLEIVGRVDDQR